MSPPEPKDGIKKQEAGSRKQEAGKRKKEKRKRKKEKGKKKKEKRFGVDSQPQLKGRLTVMIMPPSAGHKSYRYPAPHKHRQLSGVLETTSVLRSHSRL
jgi:hypothetical protein